MTTDRLAALLAETLPLKMLNAYPASEVQTVIRHIAARLAAAGVTVAPQPAHSDGCAGNCGTNNHDNPPCPAQDAPPAEDWHEVPCCYSIHEIEQRCPRTGRTFWDKDEAAQPAPDALRAAAQAVVEHRAGEHGVVAYSCGLRLDDHIAALRAALGDEP